jgi:hypothetical protein
MRHLTSLSLTSLHYVNFPSGKQAHGSKERRIELNYFFQYYHSQYHHRYHPLRGRAEAEEKVADLNSEL